MPDIGYAGALLGGVATIGSPCSAMLLPAFFAYAFASTRTLVTRTAVLWLGLVTTLVPLGVAAGTVGALFVRHRSAFVAVVAGLVIVLGLAQALGVRPRLPGAATRRGTSALAVFLLGTVYGVAGACAGPLLGAVLSVAALGQDPVRGGVLLGIFALGMVVPLLVLALLWDALDLGRRAWLRPRPVRLGPLRTTVGELVAGLLLVAIGAGMLATDGFSALGGPLDAETQRGLESGLWGWSAGVADLVVVVVIVAVVASCVAVHQWAAGRGPRTRG